MFNPKTSINLESLWNSLGTFYSKMLPEGKKLVENYWQSLFDGMEGLYYDLYQVNLSTYLEHSPGFIEQGYNEYDIIFEGVGKNTSYIPKYKGNYYYTLPDEGLYLSLPTLSGVNTNQVLYEGIDYEIHNYREIKFLKPLTQESLGSGPTRFPGTNIQAAVSGLDANTKNLPHAISETFLSEKSITLLPSLTNFIIPSFGQEYPEILLSGGYYEPFTSGWRSGVLDDDYLEKQKQYARHLTKWSQALIGNFKKPPTVPNLEQS